MEEKKTTNYIKVGALHVNIKRSFTSRRTLEDALYSIANKKIQEKSLGKICSVSGLRML